ncbi:Di-sulfide bridge nucleocytoplasmic transport domain-containing protein [Lentinula edodes]|nr:Di-sulfide bridge nucleocytoplasmic transport domain-containing protein [Lentinula edodes]
MYLSEVRRRPPVHFQGTEWKIQLLVGICWFAEASRNASYPWNPPSCRPGFKPWLINGTLAEKQLADPRTFCIAQPVKEGFWTRHLRAIGISFLCLLAWDMGLAFTHAQEKIEAEGIACVGRYNRNRCWAPVPQTEEYCAMISLCMNQSWMSVGFTRIAVATLAETLNSFFKAVAIKTMIWIMVLGIAYFFMRAPRT